MPVRSVSVSRIVIIVQSFPLVITMPTFPIIVPSTSPFQSLFTISFSVIVLFPLVSSFRSVFAMISPLITSIPISSFLPSSSIFSLVIVLISLMMVIIWSIFFSSVSGISVFSSALVLSVFGTTIFIIFLSFSFLFTFIVVMILIMRCIRFPWGRIIVLAFLWLVVLVKISDTFPLATPTHLRDWLREIHMYSSVVDQNIVHLEICILAALTIREFDECVLQGVARLMISYNFTTAKLMNHKI